MRFCVPVLSVSESVFLYGSLCGQSCNATFRRLRRLQKRGGRSGGRGVSGACDRTPCGRRVDCPIMGGGGWDRLRASCQAVAPVSVSWHTFAACHPGQENSLTAYH